MVLAIVIFAIATLSWVIAQWRERAKNESEVQPTNEVQASKLHASEAQVKEDLNVENLILELESKEKDSNTKQEKQKKVLLRWVATTLPNKGISNFSSDWNDGINLSALVDYCKPGLTPNHASLDSKNALQNITNAMNIAEENFGIPQVMHPEDLAVEKPDEHSVMTYISYFHHFSMRRNSRPGTISAETSGSIAVQIHDKGRGKFNTCNTS